MKSPVLNLLSMKLTLVSMVLTCLFLIGASDLQAQNPTTNVNTFSTPKISFVDPAIAIPLVEAKADALKSQLSSLTPGSPSYNVVFAKYTFYQTILENLNEGKSTKESYQAGLNLYATDAMSALSASEWQALKQETTNLLKA